MVNYAISSKILWFIIIFIFSLLIFIAFLIYKYYSFFLKDIMIIIDKNNRWRLIYTKFTGDKKEIDNKVYFLTENHGILNRKGKALFIFSENRPNPLQLGYNSAKWLTGESLMGIINNKLAQQIVKPKDNFKDILYLYGSIGGLIAGLASVIILLIQLGVIGG